MDTGRCPTPCPNPTEVARLVTAIPLLFPIGHVPFFSGLLGLDPCTLAFPRSSVRSHRTLGALQSRSLRPPNHLCSLSRPARRTGHNNTDGPEPCVDPHALAHAPGVAHYGPPTFDLTLRSINLARHIGVEATPEMVHTLETIMQSTMEEPKPSPSIKHPCLKERITSVCDEDTSVNWQEAVQGWTALDSPTVPQLGPGWTMLDNSHIIMDLS